MAVDLANMVSDMVGTRVIDAREVVGNEKCRVALKCLKRSERRNGGRIKNDYGKVGCVLLSVKSFVERRKQLDV